MHGLSYSLPPLPHSSAAVAIPSMKESSIDLYSHRPYLPIENIALSVRKRRITRKAAFLAWLKITYAQGISITIWEITSSRQWMIFMAIRLAITRLTVPSTFRRSLGWYEISV